MTICKAPFEQFAVSIDFSADIGAGNSIASITSVTAVSSLSGLDSTADVIASAPAPAISTSGTAIVFTVAGYAADGPSGGVVGERHTVSVQIVSSIGEKYQGDVTLEIVS
jgi:hypothetical protein